MALFSMAQINFRALESLNRDVFLGNHFLLARLCGGFGRVRKRG